MKRVGSDSFFFTGGNLLSRDSGDQHFAEAAKLISSLGFKLVDLNVRKKDGVAKVSAILWKDGGFGIDDCAKAHRVLLPRMEVTLSPDEVVMEVSSPGLDRNLRFTDEFQVFLGKKVKVLRAGQSEWDKGKIQSAENPLILSTANGPIEIPFDTITKAKLDDI